MQNNPTNLSHSTNATGIRFWMRLLFFTIICFAIYSNTFNSPFYLDDSRSILLNPQIRVSELSWENIIDASIGKSLNRPVSMLSFAINYYLGKYHVFGYHVFNIIIHLINSILLFAFVKTTLKISTKQNLDPSIPQSLNLYPVKCGAYLTRASIPQSSPCEMFTKCNVKPISPWQSQLNKGVDHSSIAFFTALLWLVNPLHTNSVTYIVQRMNSMAAMFFVLSLLLYAKGRMIQIQIAEKSYHIDKLQQTNNKFQVSSFKFHYIFFTGCILTGILAMGCKEISVTLPFFIALYEWYFFQDLRLGSLKKYFWWISGTIIAIAVLATIYFILNPRGLDIILSGYHDRPFTPFQRIISEFRVVVHYLSLFFFPHPSRLIFVHAYPISYSLTTPLTTLPSLFAILSLMGLGVYLAKKERLLSFCIFWYFGNLAIESSIIPLALMFEHRTYLPFMLISLMSVMIAFRYIKNRWVTAAAICIIVFVFSLWTYERNMTWQEDIVLWTDCIEKSPNSARSHQALAVALLSREKIDQAAEQALISVQLNPDYADGHLLLGLILGHQGKLSEAEEHLSKAYKLSPALAAASQSLLGISFAKQEKIDEAIKYFSRSLSIDPDFAEAHANMGQAMRLKHMPEKAIYHFMEVLRINREDLNAHIQLGAIFEEQGNLGEAIHNYKKAIELDPDSTEGCNNLAWIYATNTNPEIRNTKKTLELAEHACKLSGYKDPVCLDTLAAAYAESEMYDRACQTAQKAITLSETSGNPTMVSDIKKRLELYKSGMPVRTNSMQIRGDDG